MGGKGLSQSRGVEALEAGRSKGLMELVCLVCGQYCQSDTRHWHVAYCCKSFQGIVTVKQWRYIGLGKGGRDESEAQHTFPILAIVDVFLGQR
jgi:hypothetical protein